MNLWHFSRFSTLFFNIYTKSSENLPENMDFYLYHSFCGVFNSKLDGDSVCVRALSMLSHSLHVFTHQELFCLCRRCYNDSVCCDGNWQVAPPHVIRASKLHETHHSRPSDTLSVLGLWVVRSAARCCRMTNSMLTAACQKYRFSYYLFVCLSYLSTMELLFNLCELKLWDRDFFFSFAAVARSCSMAIRLNRITNICWPQSEKVANLLFLSTFPTKIVM